MLARRSTVSARQTLASINFPAPVSGLNTMVAGSQIPPSECIRAYNVVAAEYGIRARLGYREWAIGLTGATEPSIRTIIPFAGPDVTRNKLFCCTSSGIWNVSSAGATTVAWAGSTAYVAGNGVTSGGTIYICKTGGTSASSGGLPSIWAISTAYVLNDRVIANGNAYICSQAGTSASSGTGPSGTGTNITDGTAKWNYQSTQYNVTDGTVIWSLASSNTAPTLVIAFSSTTGDAGWGTYTNFVNSAGHFLIYCDEVNGLYIYVDSTGTWSKIASGTTQPWAASTSYLVNDQVVNNSNVYRCTTAGVSAASGGPSGTGGAIADNTVVWTYISAASSTAIGASLNDQRAGITCDPSTFVFVTSFKNRLWFVQRSTGRAWYLNTNSIYGTASSFELGGKFRQGGYLIGLWNWTLDGGAGIDDNLVAISAGGDIVIYQGTDPSSATTFGLKGVWYAGSPVAGRRIATNFGGDVLILSKAGLFTLSSLVIGRTIEQGQYLTARISNLFNQITLSTADINGWALRLHPEDSSLMILIPTGALQATNQLVMSLTTKGWFEYRDLPIYSAEVYNGKMYFGTADGRICVNDGYVDNVSLADSTVYSSIQWRLLHGFKNLGNARMKMVQMIRPIILCDGGVASYSAAARYKYDFSELSTVAVVGGSGGWDSGLWDSAVWGGDFTANQNVTGAIGMGTDFSVMLRGAATTRTILVGTDVFFKQGGYL